jgi:methanogenic corrinoid protein MtbC1
MLKWCSYCQKFIGEVPDYHNFNFTDGMCDDCAPRGFALSDPDYAKLLVLKKIHTRLLDAAERKDLKDIADIIAEGTNLGIRPVDALITVIAPSLYQIGENWKFNICSVAEEHQFTAFCEKMYELVAGNVEATGPTEAMPVKQPEILLMNAPGNSHTLAIRLMTLWFITEGLSSQVTEPPSDIEAFATLISLTQPKVLLISMALSEQSTGVAAIAARLAELPALVRPMVAVGGYAVKAGLISEISGAELVCNIHSIRQMCSAQNARTTG